MEILIVLLLVLFFASFWDYKKGKIPNLLLAIGTMFGLLRIIYYQNFLQHIPGIMLPVLLLYPLFKIGTIGAGDIKLFSVMGFYLSFMENIYCMSLSFVIAAVISLLTMTGEGKWIDRITYLISYLKSSFLKGKFRYYYQLENGRMIPGDEINKTKIHLAIPIFISVIIHFGGGLI